MAKRLITAFAENGDRTAVPDGTQADGAVNYNQGYPPQYSLDIRSNPTARRLNRNRFNQIMHDISDNAKEWQEQVYPDYITPTSNGGSAFSYNQGTIVRFNNGYRISLVNANVTAPDNNSNWADAFPLPVALGGTGANSATNARSNLGIVNSSLTSRGIIELANNAEGSGGSDAERAITSAVLLYSIQNAGAIRTALEGVSQGTLLGTTYNNETSSRSQGTTYTNMSTTVTMVVMLELTAQTTSGELADILVGGTIILSPISVNQAGLDRQFVSFFVAPGQTYRLNTNGVSINRWVELR